MYFGHYLIFRSRALTSSLSTIFEIRRLRVILLDKNTIGNLRVLRCVRGTSHLPRNIIDLFHAARCDVPFTVEQNDRNTNNLFPSILSTVRLLGCAKLNTVLQCQRTMMVPAGKLAQTTRPCHRSFTHTTHGLATKRTFCHPIPPGISRRGQVVRFEENSRNTPKEDDHYS